MSDTVLADVALHPHDEGLPNIADGNEDWNPAGLQMMLAQAVQSGSYARSDSELDFAGHDGTNNTVDVNPGVAYLALAGETVTVQSSLGGSTPPAYDTTITAATMPAICVVVPTATTVDMQDATTSQVWLAYATDGTVTGVDAGDVYLRSDDTGSVTAPPHPNVELGTANPDNASADTLLNRFGSPTFGDVTVQGAVDAATATVTAIAIANHPDVNDIEFGSESFQSGGSASDDTWGTNSINSTSVTFNTEFSATPDVIVAQDQAGATRGIAYRTSVSTTGFDINHVQYRTVSAATIEVSWVAIA